MQVDLSRIVGLGSYEARDKIIDDILRESKDADDPVYISDLLADTDTGEPLLEALREDQEPRHILHFMRDEWGNVVEPGDTIRRKFKRSLTVRGKLIPAKTLNSWKRAGVYEQKRFTFREFKADSKGCIKVNALDCEYFLTHYGIHAISGMPISFYHREHGEDLAMCPDGQMRHPWYWRCKEMTKEMYAKLPDVPKTNEPKRGHPKDKS
jgi:hypothetical protein